MTYAPRSPDLSHTQPYQDPSFPFSQQPSSFYNPPQPFQQQHSHDSFSYPQSSYDLPHSSQPHLQQQQQQQQQTLRQPKTLPIKHEHVPSWQSEGPPAPMPSHTRVRKQVTTNQEPAQRLPAPGEAEGIVIKTKFPVARIKRIVQADEEVGKVAQVTPVVVSKALELFMISLTLRAATIARTRGSKRLTAAHLKQAVGTDEHFDFLSEVVSKIPDAPTSKDSQAASTVKGEKKQESDGDDLDTKEDVKPKRKRAAAAGGVPGGRKRRTKGADD